MPFRGCVCTLQRLLLEPSRCRIRQCLLAGITVPVAFAPFSHPSPAPCFMFSPSLLLFWNPLTRPFTAFGLLGTKQSLTVTQSTRNPSRNPAAKAVSSGNRICGNGCLCTPLLTLPLIPDTLKSPFLCTLSMTKTPEASQPSLFPYFLLSLANCCGIQSDVSHLNLDFAGEASLLLALHGEKRPKLGKSQGPANAEIWPRAPITRFPTLVVKKEQRRKKKKKLGEPWCCSESRVSSWKVERILKQLGAV